MVTNFLHTYNGQRPPLADAYACLPLPRRLRAIAPPTPASSSARPFPVRVGPVNAHCFLTAARLRHWASSVFAAARKDLAGGRRTLVERDKR